MDKETTTGTEFCKRATDGLRRELYYGRELEICFSGH